MTKGLQKELDFSCLKEFMELGRLKGSKIVRKQEEEQKVRNEGGVHGRLISK